MPSPAAGSQAGHDAATGLFPGAPVTPGAPAPSGTVRAAGDVRGYAVSPAAAGGPQGAGRRAGEGARQDGPGAAGGGDAVPAEITARLRPVPGSPGPLPAQVPPPPVAPPVTPAPGATRRRPVGAVDLGPQPGAPRPPAHFAAPRHWGVPETPAETTTRLRPVRTRRPARVVAAAACLVLGAGLVGGAVTGSWLTGGADAGAAAPTGYAEARGLWHSAPVDTLFPPSIKGDGAGPGGADRVWTRVAVAPDSGCAQALDPLLLKALEPVGCLRLLRATYTDATTSSVTTVGMLFTEADAPAMKALRARFSNEGLADRTDLMPRTYPAEGTAAAGFGDRQRASWTVRVLTDVPVVVYAVSGFADGRTVADPQPAGRATVPGATNAPAQAGLGHEAKGIADRVERGLRRTAHPATEPPR
ncbi:hypothetical protein [Streptomyces flavidovirens]|uniref:Uncharacterized protein n=1 Tax=Streptomyces flavidovirens TaxID=67298 RepID=A0ABW6RL84_9ACTN